MNTFSDKEREGRRVGETETNIISDIKAETEFLDGERPPQLNAERARRLIILLTALIALAGGAEGAGLIDVTPWGLSSEDFSVVPPRDSDWRFYENPPGN